MRACVRVWVWVRAFITIFVNAIILLSFHPFMPMFLVYVQLWWTALLLTLQPLFAGLFAGKRTCIHTDRSSCVTSVGLFTMNKYTSSRVRVSARVCCKTFVVWVMSVNDSIAANQSYATSTTYLGVVCSCNAEHHSVYTNTRASMYASVSVFVCVCRVELPRTNFSMNKNTHNFTLVFVYPFWYFEFDSLFLKGTNEKKFINFQTFPFLCVCVCVERSKK